MDLKLKGSVNMKKNCIIFTFRNVLLKCLKHCSIKKLKQKASAWYMVTELCQRLRIMILLEL